MPLWSSVLQNNDIKYKMARDNSSQFFENANNAYRTMHSKGFTSCSVDPWRFQGFTRFDQGYTYIADYFGADEKEVISSFTYIWDNENASIFPFGIANTYSGRTHNFSSNTSFYQNEHKLVLWVEVDKMENVALKYRQRWLYPNNAVYSEVAPDMGLNGSYQLLENSPIESNLYCVKAIHYYINDNDGEYSQNNPRQEYKSPKTNFHTTAFIPFEVNSWTKENQSYTTTQRLMIPLSNILGINSIGGMGRNTTTAKRQKVANFFNGTAAYLLGYNIHSFIECDESFVDAQDVVNMQRFNAYHTVYFTKTELTRILNDFGIPWSFNLADITNKNTQDYPDYKKPGKPTNPVNPDNGDGDNYSDPMLPVVPSISPYDCYATTYICRKKDINALSNYMWSDEFITQVKKLWESPAELITANVFFPLDLSENAIGSPEQVVIGNCTAPENCTGIPINSTYSRRISSDEYTVKAYFGNFLDYEPYSKYYLYLPYIGFQQISASDIVGQNIHIEYVLELESGNCTAFIYSGERLLSQTNGACGSQIGLSSSNNLLKYLSLYNSALKIGQGATEMFGGALSVGKNLDISSALSKTSQGAGNLSNGINDFVNAFQMQTITPSDKVTGLNGLYAPQDCYLLAVHPTPAEAKNLKSLLGREASFGGTLSEFTGFVKCSVAKGNTSATDSENKKIENYLKGGIYV